MKLGIVGLPNVGKSTLFNALQMQVQQVQTSLSAQSNLMLGLLPFRTNALTNLRKCTTLKSTHRPQ